MAGEDLGEVFGRVLALSQTISHPAFQRATEGFAENGRVYLVYADEELKALRRGSTKRTGESQSHSSEATPQYNRPDE